MYYRPGLLEMWAATYYDNFDFQTGIKKGIFTKKQFLSILWQRKFQHIRAR